MHGVHVFGVGFVVLGVVSLAGAAGQHLLIVRTIGRPTYRYRGFRPLAAVVTVVLLALGIYALTTIAHPR